MDRKDLIIFGSKGFAELAAYYFEQDSPYNLRGYCVDAAYLTDTTLHGKPVFAAEELDNICSPQTTDIFVAIGIQSLNQSRTDKCEEMKSKGFSLAHYLSPKAIIPKELVLQPNTMIMEHVIIQPFSTIGANCIIWSASHIALKNEIQDNCWIASATIGENCVIGQNTFIGIEATVMPNRRIGTYNILGARSIVKTDTGNYGVYPSGGKRPAKVKSDKISRLIY